MKFQAKVQVNHNQFKTLQVESDTQQEASIEAGKVGLVVDIAPTEIIVDNGFEVKLYFLGKGYPYDCQDAKNHPESKVYYSYSHGSWVASHELVQKPNGVYRIK